MMLKDKNKMTSLATNTNDADYILKDYRATLNDHQIFESKTDTDANNRYAHLRGSLQLMIEREQARLGRPVKAWTPQEEKNIMDKLINDTKSGKKGWFGGDIMEPGYEQVYRTEVAPEMPAIVKQRAPNAKWNIETGTWQAVMGGRLQNISTEVNPPGNK